MPGPRRKTTKPDNTGRIGRPKTEAQWSLFLEKLSECANLTRSAEFAGIERTTVYEKRKRDPEFDAKYQEAYQTGYDALEERCQARAFEGIEEPVFYKGECVASVTKFSDPLAMFLLRGCKPDKFRERVETINGGGPGASRFASLTNEELEAELKRRLG